MKPPKFPHRPLVRRRGMLWCVVCQACHERRPAPTWRYCWDSGIEHAESAEHLAAVRDELIRDGVRAKTVLKERFMAASESGFGPDGEADFNETAAYETARVDVGATTRALAEFLIATGEQPSETAIATAIVMIGDATKALEASGLEEAA